MLGSTSGSVFILIYFRHHIFHSLICQNVWLQLSSMGGDCHVLKKTCCSVVAGFAGEFEDRSQQQSCPCPRTHSCRAGRSRWGWGVSPPTFLHFCSISAAFLQCDLRLQLSSIYGVHGSNINLCLHNCLLWFLQKCESYSPCIPFPGHFSNTHPKHFDRSAPWIAGALHMFLQLSVLMGSCFGGCH